MAINFGDDNPRFRHDNIQSLVKFYIYQDVDLPERTTEQDEGKL